MAIVYLEGEAGCGPPAGYCRLISAHRGHRRIGRLAPLPCCIITAPSRHCIGPAAAPPQSLRHRLAAAHAPEIVKQSCRIPLHSQPTSRFMNFALISTSHDQPRSIAKEIIFSSNGRKQTRRHLPAAANESSWARGRGKVGEGDRWRRCRCSRLRRGRKS